MASLCIRFAILLFLGILLAMSQTFTARLTGRVLDPSGSPIAGAIVTAIQSETNASKGVSTDETGVYVIPILLPGTYEVSVSAPGFQKQVKLEINQSAGLDFSLVLAGVSTGVVVTEEAPVLQTEGGNVGTTISAQTIDELPLVQRDVMAVVRIAGCVSAVAIDRE